MVRVGSTWRDQCRETGHYDRVGDFDAIASLGVRAVRYPVLWEHVAPEAPDRRDWRWADERLSRLRVLGIAPIVGLSHHGSGPHYTNLLAPEYPRLLSDQAQATAERYPWVKLWTPVNEPVTTARFSGLYGLWYPHLRDHDAFLRMVVNQCRAVLLSMRAIRSVIPDARLVQTEDVGRAFSTGRLAGQAAYENERRWLSFDLLSGFVNRFHPWRSRLEMAGVSPSELDDFRAGDLGPMTLGVNHYITSERFLDHRLHLYPGRRPEGTGRDLYIDIEAVRAPMSDRLMGWEPRLREVWERYGQTPIALTEVQMASSPDNRVRWLMEAWRAVQKLNCEGADICAITLWAVMGAMDWCSLLTRQDGIYEAGAFDLSGGEIKPNLLAEAAASLALRNRFDHPVLETAGWWHQPERLPEHLRAAGLALKQVEVAPRLRTEQEGRFLLTKDGPLPEEGRI